MIRYFKMGTKISKHCANRMKLRLNMKSPLRRRKFMNRAKDKALLVADIPTVDLFYNLINYLKKLTWSNTPFSSRKIKLNNQVYLYKDFILIISDNNTAITILEVPLEFKGLYEDIVKYNKEKVS